MHRVLPILFNAYMIRAILDDRKTVTRRLVKLPYYVDGDETNPQSLIVLRTAPKGSELYNEIGRMPYPDTPWEINDVLYVRETWGNYSYDHHDSNATYYLYRADYPDGARTYEFDGITCDLPKWHPSIHMPKEAARIWLKVTDVRVERLQDITEKQAEKEGLQDNVEYCRGNTARGHFKDLWNSTVKKSDLDRYGWDANPWVWVIEFERCEKPEE